MPLLPSNVDGSQSISKHYCLIPCRTCDYISPEILLVHENALLALEINDDKDDQFPHGSLKDGAEGYSVETDWWSLGTMLYEKLPLRTFSGSVCELVIVPRVRSHIYIFSGLLTNVNQRLGRRNVMEITDHPLFDGVDRRTLPNGKVIILVSVRMLQYSYILEVAPTGLHLPQFTYTTQDSHEYRRYR